MNKLIWYFNYLKIKIKYKINSNTGNLIYYSDNKKERGNGKTTLIIKDAIKHGYSILTSSDYQTIIDKLPVDGEVKWRKNYCIFSLKDKRIFIFHPSNIENLWFLGKAKILIDGDQYTEFFIKENEIKIVNGFVYKSLGDHNEH